MDLLENEAIFPDPDAFLPERWLSESTPASSTQHNTDEPPRLGTAADATFLRRKWALMAIFGGGTRMCAGMHLAWAELFLTVGIVMRRFGGRIQLHDVDFERDIKIVRDGFDAMPSRESKGLRVVVLPQSE